MRDGEPARYLVVAQILGPDNWDVFGKWWVVEAPDEGLYPDRGVDGTMEGPRIQGACFDAKDRVKIGNRFEWELWHESREGCLKWELDRLQGMLRV
jgi:hypothetical protein